MSYRKNSTDIINEYFVNTIMEMDDLFCNLHNIMEVCKINNTTCYGYIYIRTGKILKKWSFRKFYIFDNYLILWKGGRSDLRKIKFFLLEKCKVTAISKKDDVTFFNFDYDGDIYTFGSKSAKYIRVIYENLQNNINRFSRKDVIV